MKKNTLMLLIIFCTTVFLTSCGSNVSYSSSCWTENNSSVYQRSFTEYFNTSITVRICSDTMSTIEYSNTLLEAESIIEKYDQITSKRVNYDGIVNVKTINDDPSATHILSDELFELLEFSLDYYEITEGRFNIALDPVVSLWETPLGDFEIPGDAVYRPSDETIATALVNTNASKIILNDINKTITMDSGMSLNLGGIAKGYMVDVLYDFLDNNDGVTSFSINAGGSSIRFGGQNPSTQRDYWSVAIQNPIGFDMLNYTCYISGTSNTDCYYQTINLDSGEVVSTSGDYQKYFYDYNDYMENGLNAIKYHHIIDPNTGLPVNTNVKSVSVIANSSKIAEIESTNIYIMSLDNAINYVNNNSNIEAIWYLSNGTVVKSNNF